MTTDKINTYSLKNPYAVRGMSINTQLSCAFNLCAEMDQIDFHFHFFMTDKN